MKVLIVYYSRTNTTKNVAEKLAGKLKAEIEEIIDTKNREGMLGYMSAAHDAMKEKPTKIKEPEKDPSSYDLVIIATPIWAWNIPPAIRTYIKERKKNISQLALLITQGAKPPKQVELFQKIEELTGKKSLANLHLSTIQAKNDKYDVEVEKFIKDLGVEL